MRKFLLALAAAALISGPAAAALKVGDKAPDFTTTGAVGGQESSDRPSRAYRADGKAGAASC